MAELKLATVNLGRVLDDSKRGKAQATLLRQAAEKWHKQLAELQGRLSAGRDKLDKLPPEPAEPRQRLARELRALELELTHQQQKARLDLEGRREAARVKVLAELDPVLAKLAAERQLALVLAVPATEVAWAAPALDITAELIARFDAS